MPTTRSNAEAIARARGYAEVEHWADEAVARAPDQAEGYLWQGVARGRIATSAGNLRIALAGMVGAFENQLTGQIGKTITAAQAATILQLLHALYP